MAIATFDTRDIQISSVSFRQNQSERRFDSYPRRIVFGGREYAVVEK